MTLLDDSPFDVAAETLTAAMHDAHALGRRVSNLQGDAAYPTLHPA